MGYPRVSMADHEVAIPQISGRITVTEPGLFSGSKLLVDGQPAPKAGWGSYWLTRPDGSRVKARLVKGFTNLIPAVVVGSLRYDVGPKLPAFLVAFAVVPLLLLFVGGAVGGLCGGVGWVFNNQIARTSLPTLLKIPLMLGVAAVAFGVYVLVAGAIHLALHR
jgi:hypothetical protein